jgi:hypothetical protein
MWVTEQQLVAAGGGLMVAVDILVIRMLIFLVADFGCATKKSGIQLLDIEHMHSQ